MHKLFPIFLALLVSLPAWADITVNLRNRNVALDAPFQIEVRVSGSSVGQVTVPESEDVFVAPSPMSKRQNVSFQILNGRQSRVMELFQVYRAKANRLGEITIPPFKAIVDGKEAASKPIVIQVSEGKVQPNTVGPNNPQSSGGNPNRELTLDDAVFIDSRVDKTSVYLGEVVELSLSLNRLDFNGVQLLNTRRGYRPPNAEGFYINDHVEVNQRIEHDGLPYLSQSFVHRLYPTQTGELTIDSWRWQGGVRALTNLGPQRIEKDLRTEPIRIEVKPLPKAPDQYSGTVGEYMLYVNFQTKDNTQPDSIQLEQGRPAVMRLTLEGRGNEHAIKTPKLPDIPWAQVADPKAETQMNLDDGLITRKFSYAFTALEAGTFELPAIEYCFFSPEQETYITRTVDRLVVNVAPSKERTDLVVVGGMDAAQQQEIDVVVSKLHPIEPQSDLQQLDQPSLLLLILFILLTPLGYGVFVVLLNRHRRLSGNTGAARAHRARSKSAKRVAAALATDNPAEALFKAVVGYLADHCNENEAGMTSQDALQLMQRKGIPEDLAGLVHRILKSCERSQYGGTVLSSEELQALGDGALEALDNMESYFRKGGHS